MPIPHLQPISHTTNLSLRWLTAVLLIVWLLISCGGGDGGGGGAVVTPLSSAKDITSFTFTKTANPKLAYHAHAAPLGLCFLPDHTKGKALTPCHHRWQCQNAIVKIAANARPVCVCSF
jgi:hypothetical protein